MAIPTKIKQLAHDVRNKIYGRDVRESIAKGMEESGDIADESNQRSINTDNRQNHIEARYDVAVGAHTEDSEVLDARVGAGGKATYINVKKRLDSEYNETVKKFEDVSFNVKDFGAVGDGVTDDTLAINSAIIAADGKKLNIPNTGKEYIISDEISLRDVEIISDGAKIKMITAGKNGFRGENLGKISFSNLKFIGLGAKDGSELNECNILLEKCNNIYISNVEVEESRGQSAIRLVDCWTGVVKYNKVNRFSYAGIQVIGDCRHIYVDANDIKHSLVRTSNKGGSYGVHISALASSANYPKNIHVTRNNVENIKSWDAYNAHGGENIYFTDNSANDVRIGIDVGLHYYNSDSILKNIVIKNNILEGTSVSVNGNTASGIMVHGHDDSIAENVVIDGNIVNGFNHHETGVGQMGGIRAGKVKHLTIINNKTDQNKAYGIRLTDKVSHFVISDNDVKDSSGRCIYLGYGGIEFGQVHGNIVTQTGSSDFEAQTAFSCGSPGSLDVYEYNNKVDGVNKYDRVNDSGIGLFKQEFIDRNPADFGDQNNIWYPGDSVKNGRPVAGGYSGYICIFRGSPGVWKGYGLIQS